MTGSRDPDPVRLLAAHDAANEFYRSHLTDELRALRYLRSRGIVAATAQSAPWTIGYAPRGWTALRDHLRGHDFADDELLAAGLVTTARNGNLIDVFRDRVMFPIRNATGQVVAFTGRDLSGQPETPKYRNTTTTAIYQKKSMLYGLAEQFGGDVQPAAVMLVEGPADVVAVARLRQSLPSEGYPDPYLAVAPCGTALTGEQVALLADAVPPGTPIVSAFDADTAGAAAIDKSYQLLRDWPGPVEAMALPAGTDPASLVAAGPADAVAGFNHARVPLVDLLLEHRLAPHLRRLQARLAELDRFERDPSSEAVMIKLDAMHAVEPLITEVAAADPADAARLCVGLATRLELNPLTVYEAIYPPDETTAAEPDTAASTDPIKPTRPVASTEPAGAVEDAAEEDRPAIALGGAGFPDPEAIGHQYARACPPHAPAATWVAHDPVTGHAAWVLVEGVTDTPADRDAARLAAEVAGRVAVVVGAQQAVAIARVAVNAHFAALGPDAQGNASIGVLASFDGDTPQPGRGRFTVAWAGTARAYANTGRWFAPLTVDHTLRERGTGTDQRHQAARLLGQPPMPATGPPDVRQRRLITQATDPDWLARADLLDLALAWSTTRTFEGHHPAVAAAVTTVEQRLRELYPQALTGFDEAVRAGTAPAEAMGVAAPALPGTPRRAGDEALTASVRGGPIGVNRLDLPATQILLTGRALREIDPARLREALDGRRPGTAIGAVSRLGPGVVAVVVRPRPDRAWDAMTAARLARQDQAATNIAGPVPPPRAARRAVLPAALVARAATL
jgi:DNA primase catalytic core